jgi:hypothetical protein
MWVHIDAFAKFLRECLQPRPPDVAQSLQNLSKIFQPLLAAFKLLKFSSLQLRYALVGCGKLRIDSIH